MIYLDSAATTKIDPSVLKEMLPYLQDEFGNAGTLYSAGRRAKQAIELARQRVASLINCDPDEIIFTSGGTEGNNLVILGLAEHLKAVGKTHIIVSAVEHKSVLRAADSLIKQGFYVTHAPVNKCGIVDPDVIDELIGPDTGLVSVMMVNNEIGSKNPVEEIGELCNKRGVLFHTDCVQSASTFKLDVSELQCDFLTISSHKIHGPKGAGAVFSNQKHLLSPIIFGGDSQEFGVRGGTENVPSIVGFGLACKRLHRDLEFSTRDAILMLKHRFFSELIHEMSPHCTGECVKVNGGSLDNDGKVLSLCFNGIDAETLLLALDSHGVCVSAGSACNSKTVEPSHVLNAIGLTYREARQTIRLSFDASNSITDIDSAAKVFVKCILALKREDNNV